jgi:hypothetical protein
LEAVADLLKNFMGLALVHFQKYWLLISNVINEKACRKNEKFPGFPKEARKKIRAEILTIFSLLFWKIDVLINSF